MASILALWATIIAAGTLVLPATALFFVTNCYNELVQERIDPIISPGLESGHVHTVYGANGFNFSTTYTNLRASTCTSCQYANDKSVYWTPKLYFQKTDGSIIPVPYQGGSGMAIYYESGYNTPSGDAQLNPFPPGFRMAAGNPSLRTCDGNPSQVPIAMSCNGNVAGGNGQKYTYFPDHNCPTSLRLEINFPACWDGKNLYLESSAHMSYAANGGYKGGNCPDSHPVPLPGLFFEVGYDISQVPMGSGGKLVFASGDASGCGLHGDFYNGWDNETLYTAMKTNSNPIEEDSAARASCSIPRLLTEATEGTLTALPGCNPVTGKGLNAAKPKACSKDVSPGGKMVTDPTPAGQPLPGASNANTGPGGKLTTSPSSDPAATKPHSVAAKVSTATSGEASQSTSTSTTQSQSIGGFTNLGCAYDPVTPRALASNDWEWNPSMTNAMCVAFCSSKGYTYAGTEDKNQCFCSNSISSSNLPPQSKSTCNAPCAGDASQMCGGNNALTLWKKSGGSKERRVEENKVLRNLKHHRGFHRV